jgi:putative transposase
MPRPRKPASPFRYFNSSPEVIRMAVMLYVISAANIGPKRFHQSRTVSWQMSIPYLNSRSSTLRKLSGYRTRRQRVSRMKGFRQWRWHVDEVFVKINGERHYMWRAVDHEGEVLESYVTKKRDKSAALRFLKKALKRHGRAEAIVTDGLKSYPAAMKELGNQDRREMGRWLNNRAENSHLPFRRRERAMQRFRRMKSLQKFASVHASFHNHFNSERHLVDRETYKARRSAALAEWQNLAA